MEKTLFTDEQFDKLIEFIENLDSNRMMSELASCRRDLISALKPMSFNPGGEDINGNQTRYAILEKEITRLDDLIVKCIDKI